MKAMKKLMAVGLTLAMIITSIAALPVFAAEADEPITTITSAEDLKTFADTVNSGTDYRGMPVKVTADIDLSGYADWTPIGSDGNTFRGTFDGGEHVISNLKINLPDQNNVGLFGAFSGTISNVTIKDADVVGNQAVGSLIGTTVTNEINNCHVIGTVTTDENNEKTYSTNVTGTHWVGGLVGYSYANYESCTAKGVKVTAYSDDIELSDKAGGIAGFMGEGNYYIKNCSANDVYVTAGRDAGGLVGTVTGSDNYYTLTVDNCTVNDSTIIATGIFIWTAPAGGFFGRLLTPAVFNNQCAVTNTTYTSYSGENYQGEICGQFLETGRPLNFDNLIDGKTPTT